MTYERWTAAPVREVLAQAVTILTDRLPIAVEHEDGHAVRLSGGDGTATISAHRHGFDTVVHVETDQVRTSRLDTEVQYFLTMLPYQPEDTRPVAPVRPGGPGRAS